MQFCDLHCHSLYSDGTDSAEELIELACAAGLSAVALTDHNTLVGYNDFIKAASGRIDACFGCEFTTEADVETTDENGNIHTVKKELHLLGLFLDPDKSGVLNAKISEQTARKRKNNRETINNLIKDGYPLSYDEFCELYPGDSVNRVHIARYLIGKGYPKGDYPDKKNELFRTVLKAGGKYYVESEKLDFYEMIRLIREAGGTAVWAHPLDSCDRDTFMYLIGKAKTAGLDGAEVYYSTYSDDDTAFMREVCRDYALIESGGSDYHGKNKADISIGRGRGNLCVPYTCYENLKAVADRRKSAFGNEY